MRSHSLRIQQFPGSALRGMSAPDYRIDRKTAPSNALEAPARHGGRAATDATLDLILQALETVGVVEVETFAGVEVLDLEAVANVGGLLGDRAHALRLAGGVVAGEHACASTDLISTSSQRARDGKGGAPLHC